MRQHLFLVVAAATFGIGLAGCGNNVTHGAGAPGGGAPAYPADPSDHDVPIYASGNDGGSGETAPPDAGERACAVEWTDIQMGTALDDQIWGMTSDKSGNIYVSGFERGVTGVTNIEPDGNSQGVVMRIDASGAVRWKAVVDTDASDTIEDVAVDPMTGSIIAVGRTSGAFDGFVNQGQFDGFLVELDANARTTKLLQWGDERPQHPTRLSLGTHHDVAVVGSDDTYIPSNFVESWEDGFVASFDRGATAAAPFAQTRLEKVPLVPANRLTGVVADRDDGGSVYITSFVGGGPDVGNYVKKLNPDGSVAWTSRISRLASDAVNAVALSPSHELFVAGATFQTLGAASFGQQDAFVLKIDTTTGAVLWATQGGSAESDFPTALVVDDAGNIYVAGDTLGSVVDGATNRGDIDVFALRFDATGALLSSWQTGTPGADLATSMTVDACGRVFVGGFTHGAIVAGGQGSAGGYDMFVLRAAL